MTDVLVVGAGPTGLTLAAQLSALGTRVRIVDSRVEPRPSRAFIVQPRTLEVLAPLGVVDTMIALGDASARVRVQAGRRAATIGLTRPGGSDTPYPFLLAIPQTTVERVLEEHLRRAGVTVEWGVRFTSLTQRNDAVVSVLEGLSGRPSGSKRRTWSVATERTVVCVRGPASPFPPASTGRRSSWPT
jgi:2-polyprenyl-6-methoxyphenol hydroxylase-like FAD-dependent oxidoreductase